MSSGYCVKRSKKAVKNVTVHTLLSREAFWHEYAKIPKHCTTFTNSSIIIAIFW